MTDREEFERQARDNVLEDVAGNPHNNYHLILHAATEWLIWNTRPGVWINADDIYQAVVNQHPQLEPSEKRVMGAVIRQIRKDGLLDECRWSKRGRSHAGDGKEWRRTRNNKQDATLMSLLVRDIETRSTVDLGDVGITKYVTHPSTDVMCVGYCVDDGPVKIWRPGDPVPREYHIAARNRSWTAAAHNLNQTGTT